jgi:hypothetical protein
MSRAFKTHYELNYVVAQYLVCRLAAVPGFDPRSFLNTPLRDGKKYRLCVARKAKKQKEKRNFIKIIVFVKSALYRCIYSIYISMVGCVISTEGPASIPPHI